MKKLKIGVVEEQQISVEIFNECDVLGVLNGDEINVIKNNFSDEFGFMDIEYFEEMCYEIEEYNKSLDESDFSRIVDDMFNDKGLKNIADMFDGALDTLEEIVADYKPGVKSKIDRSKDTAINYFKIIRLEMLKKEAQELGVSTKKFVKNIDQKLKEL